MEKLLVKLSFDDLVYYSGFQITPIKVIGVQFIFIDKNEYEMLANKNLKYVVGADAERIIKVYVRVTLITNQYFIDKIKGIEREISNYEIYEDMYEADSDSSCDSS